MQAIPSPPKQHWLVVASASHGTWRWAAVPSRWKHSLLALEVSQNQTAQRPIDVHRGIIWVLIQCYSVEWLVLATFNCRSMENRLIVQQRKPALDISILICLNAYNVSAPMLHWQGKEHTFSFLGGIVEEPCLLFQPDDIQSKMIGSPDLSRSTAGWCCATLTTVD